MKRQEKIYPVTIKTKYLGHVYLGVSNIIPVLLWVGLWSFGLWHEYSVGRVNALFYASLALLPVPLIVLIYRHLHLKPLFLIDDKKIYIIYKKYEGREILLNDIEVAELKSGRVDMTSGGAGQNEIYFNNYLLLHMKGNSDVIKLPLGITRYFAGIPGSFDRRRMMKIRDKLDARNVSLNNFDLSIESQNRDYRSDVS